MSEQKVAVREVKRVAEAWLRGAWMQQTIRDLARLDARFSQEEAIALGEYLVSAQREAPTHGLIKYPHNLIIELGLRHNGLIPGAQLTYLKKRYPSQAVIPMNAGRKLGICVMAEIVARAADDVGKYGEVKYLVHNAGHFGYGGLWAGKFAELNLMGVIQNTSGRGCEVFPYGADTAHPANARMGTNPITAWFPTKRDLGFHFIADFATSSMSFGRLKREGALGHSIPLGAAVDESGRPTSDARQATLVLFENVHDYQLGLFIEGLGALMGGGRPYDRCIARDGNPGGSCDWVISVADPEVYSCASGDPIERVSSVLAGIVKDNGSARLPGASALARATQDPENVILDAPAHAAFERMAIEI
jgi:LDH2 family malate/lactate/ureidoglycolate dehydrogenase